MSRQSRGRQGFTVAELMVAIVLTVIVVAGIMTAYVQGLLIVQQEQIQNELQLDLEKATEHLRHDLRLSSVGISMMSFYPTNSSRFTAVSLPISEDTNGWVKVDTNGRVVWNKTVIYHVKPGSPDRLMRTVFENRYTNAADLLYAQLARVVAASTWADYQAARLPFGSPVETVTTNVVFANLVDIEFTPGDSNSTFDCYSDVPKKGHNVFGSIVLGPGDHVVTFAVVGKNPASSGYNFAIDKLSLSPSRSAREGELFVPVDSHPVAPYYRHAVVGGNAVACFRDASRSNTIVCNLKYTNGVLNGTLRMTIKNDLWCDSDFEAVDAVGSNCSAKLDYGFLTSPPFIPDMVVSPDMGEVWTAASCGDFDTQVFTVDRPLVSNFIYGANEWCDLKITRDGRWARFWFERAEGCSLFITNACVVDHFASPEITSNITFNGGSRGVLMPSTGPLVTNSDWIPMWGINRTGIYSVVAEYMAAVPVRGAPTFADIDGDGDFDLFIGDAEGKVRFYRNEGTVSNALFPSLTDGVWQGIRVNSRNGGCNPGFADVDGDGDLDLFLGIKGGLVEDPSVRFMFYRNTGSPTNAIMVEEPSSFRPNPCQSGSMNATPVLADVNGDGILDFCHGWNTAKYVKYFVGSTNPIAFTPAGMTIGNFTTGDLGWPVPAGVESGGNNSAPAFVDIDGDGWQELICGQGNGYLSFWENAEVTNMPTFTFVTDSYHGLLHDINSMPFFVDIDNDLDYDLFTGAQDGRIYFYENTGSRTNAAWTLRDTDYLGHAAWPVACWVNGPAYSNGYWLASVNGVYTNRIIGLKWIEAGYAPYSTYRSGVFDTLKLAPAYNEMNWTQVKNAPAGDVSVRVRSSDTPNMAGASWTDARVADDGYFPNNVGNLLAGLPHRRYLQYEVLFKINESGATPWAHTNARPDAILRDITIDWPGAQALVDLNVDFDMGPDCGIVSATVDGESLVKGVGVTAEIYKAGRTGTNTVRGTLLVSPLNTRK